MNYHKLKNNINGLNLGKMLLYLFAIAFYLPMIVTNVITILLVINVLLHYKKIDIASLMRKQNFIWLSLLYFIVFLGFLYEINTKGVMNDLEKKLSFLIFPLAVFALNITKNDYKKFLALFFFSGFTSATIAFLIGLFHLLSAGDFKNITHHDLSQNIGFHATYLSLYLLFSLVYPLLYYSSIQNKLLKRTVAFLTLGILFYIFLLSVRMVWILLVLIFVFQISLKLKSKKMKWIDALFYSSAAIMIAMILILNIAPLKERFKEAINYKNKFTVEEVWGGRGIRVLIWESCLSLTKERPLVGYGSSKEVQLRLNSLYEKENVGQLLYMMRKEAKVFNPHNQYLEDFLKFGLILGFLFPVILFAEFVYFYKIKNLAGIYFIMIIAGVAITETILELNKGIVFFSFFISFLHSCGSINKKTSLNQG